MKALAGYVQAIPIFTSADEAVKKYFTEHRSEINDETGKHIIVLVAEEIEAGNVEAIVQVLDDTGSPRFPGLKFGDLPCLWIEDGKGQHSVVKLLGNIDEVKTLLRQLADVVRKTRSAIEIERQIARRQDEAQRARFAWLFEAIREAAMDKGKEKRLAVIFGVAFVATILIIALFVPDPTGFQYTIFRIVLALAAAGFVSMTPGFIQAQVGTTIRAGGALAVFVIVYFFTPAAIAAG